jgi:hypothetical protein
MNVPSTSLSLDRVGAKLVALRINQNDDSPRYRAPTASTHFDKCVLLVLAVVNLNLAK